MQQVLIFLSIKLKQISSAMNSSYSLLYNHVGDVPDSLLEERFCERTNVSRRLLGLALLFVGSALFVLSLLEYFGNDTLCYLVLFAGLFIAVFGCVYAMFSSSMLVDVSTGQRVLSRVLYFTADQKQRLLSDINNNNWTDLSQGASSATTLPLCLHLWYTADNSFASALLMEYVPYDYVPITQLKVMSVK